MPNTTVMLLPNGVRVLAMPMPHLRSASVGVYVHTGSRNETPQTNGISHFLEHMAFKGTTTRDVQAINFDAERLGISMNAYTCKETTAYHMSGLGQHAQSMLAMLADIVCHPILPEAELARERDVIAQELAEYAEDPSSVSNMLTDQACYGSQAMGMPIIGTSGNIDRFGRDDLVRCIDRQYSGPNVVVAFAGNVDIDALQRLAADLFCGLPAGTTHAVDPVLHIGGVRTQTMAGISQVFVNIAFPIESVIEGQYPGQVAATLFGGGMSSPLYDQVRERRGLAYQVGCNAYVGDNYGSFVIDAVTTPAQLAALFGTAARLLVEHAAHVDPRHLERAKNQLCVDLVMAREWPSSAMEAAVTDLLTAGRVVTLEESLERVRAVDAKAIQGVFERMLRARPAIAMAGGKVAKEATAGFEQALR